MYGCPDDLSDLQKTERLYDIANASLPHFGLTGASLQWIQHLVNSSFRVLHGSGQWYLRIYNPDRHAVELIESELLWLEAMADHDGFRVPRPLRARDGRLVWEESRELFSQTYVVSVFNWLNGRLVPNEQREHHHFDKVGMLLGRLHSFSETWRPPAGFTRPLCTSDGVFGPHDILEVALARYCLPDKLRFDLVQARDKLIQAEAELGKDSHRFGLIHGDPSFGNILFDGDIPALIDFDDCGYGHYAYDLAVVLAGAWSQPEYKQNLGSLLKGYQQVHTLADIELRSLPYFMAARAASLILWAAAQSPQHPWIDGQWQRLREYIDTEG